MYYCVDSGETVDYISLSGSQMSDEFAEEDYLMVAGIANRTTINGGNLYVSNNIFYNVC